MGGEYGALIFDFDSALYSPPPGGAVVFGGGGPTTSATINLTLAARASATEVLPLRAVMGFGVRAEIATRSATDSGAALGFGFSMLAAATLLSTAEAWPPDGGNLVFQARSQPPYIAPAGHELSFGGQPSAPAQWHLTADVRLRLTASPLRLTQAQPLSAVGTVPVQWMARASLGNRVSAGVRVLLTLRAELWGIRPLEVVSRMGLRASAFAALAREASARTTISLCSDAAARLARAASSGVRIGLRGSGFTAPTWYLPHPVVGGGGVGVRLPWSPQDRFDRLRAGKWVQAEKKEPSVVSPWDEIDQIAPSVGSDWDQIPERQRETASPWVDFEDPLGAAVGTPYMAPGSEDGQQSLPWGDGLLPADDEWRTPYADPPPCETDQELAWDILSDMSPALDLLYSHPAIRGRQVSLVRGPRWYPQWCVWRFPLPDGGALIFNFSAPAYAPPPGNALVFDAGQEPGKIWECFDGTWSGPKDGYWYRPREWHIPQPQQRRYYIMSNTVTLVRAADGVPVPIEGLEITSDLDSWCWNLRATLKAAGDLTLVQPIGGAPAEVLATINGHQWRFLVEEWGSDRQFGQWGYTLTGRSPTALLAAPYTLPRDRAQTAQATAAQLAESELANTGFELDWQLADWLVPGGAYSLQGKTIIESLGHIAGAAGGTVQSDPAATTVSLLPWYPHLPWAWGAVAVDAVVPTWQARRTAFRPAPQYSGVYVSGVNQGVTCLVKRTGTDGASQPAMQTHPLITATPPGLALGGKVLADSGPRAIETLSLPLLPDLGLLLPGKLVEVTDSAGDWRGLVTGIGITARRPAVTQTLTLLRYLGS